MFLKLSSKVLLRENAGPDNPFLSGLAQTATVLPSNPAVGEAANTIGFG